MDGRLAGVILWECTGLLFVAYGVYCIVSRRARSETFGFWANAKRPEVTDVRAYNRALGKLWIAYGVILMLLGCFLLPGMSAALFVVPVVGMLFASIGAMAAYVTVIEKRYRKKDS